jgi:hypothetical protein
MLHRVQSVKIGEKERMTVEVFIARAECKWYSGEEELPHILGHIPRKRVKKILKSADKYPALSRRFIKNVDRVIIEPHEVSLDKDEIRKETASDGNEREVFEGELFFVVKVPSDLKMDAEELLENLNVLLRVNSKHNSTKLVAIKYLGTDIY